jgi:hypothetical protein
MPGGIPRLVGGIGGIPKEIMLAVVLEMEDTVTGRIRSKTGIPAVM